MLQVNNNDKVSSILADYLSKNNQGRVDVIIELNPTSVPKKNGSVKEFKGVFNQMIQPVQSIIEQNGGNVIDSAWINQTIKANIPSSKINEIANLQSVSSIDLPRKLQADF